MRMRWIIGIVGVWVLPTALQAEDVASVFSSRVLPVLTAHCAECHNAKVFEGKVDLSGTRTVAQLATEQKLWFKVLGQLESGAMPPDGQPPLKPADRQAIIGWI